MKLSDDENNILAELEQSLRAADPKFEKHFTSLRKIRTGRSARVGRGHLVKDLVLLLVGVVWTIVTIDLMVVVPLVGVAIIGAGIARLVSLVERRRQSPRRAANSVTHHA
jgi:Flp pilus assembly protein TadB